MDQGVPYDPRQYNQMNAQPMADPAYGGPGLNPRGYTQYYNQQNYINPYNPAYAYQAQMEAQNQQLNQIAQEKEELRRQLAQQRQFANQARQKATNSRQKDMDALELLTQFQRSIGGKRSDPLSLFDSDPDPAPDTRRRGYNDYPPASRGNYDKPPPSPGQFERVQPNYDQGGGYGFNQGGYPSPFQNAANMMINPISPGYQNMFQQVPQGIDPYTGMPVYGTQPEPKKNDGGSRTAEILMASLEKQNQILSELTSNINKDRDYKLVQETKEIENKIKQLEFESQAKQYQLFNHNTLDVLSKNYNRPINDVNLQKYSDLVPGITPNMMSPGQLMQLQSIMGPNKLMNFGGVPPFSVMPSEFMKHQAKIQYLKEKRKTKEKKKKEKLKDLLLLLGDDGGDDDSDGSDDGKKKPTDDGKPKKGGPKSKGSGKPDEDKGKLDADKKKKDDEEKKKKRKMKLRALMWTRFYPFMYYVNFYDVKGKEREEILKALPERIGSSIENTKTWATKATLKGMEMVTGNSKLNLALVAVAGKKPNPKDLEAKPAEIQKILKSLLDGLTNNTKTEIIPSTLLSFLVDISQNFKYVPQNFFFAFELNRLNFTHTAALKDSNNYKTQMIVSFFVLARVFLAEMLLQPTKVSNNLKVTDVMMRNFKTLASILMLILIDYLRSRVVIQNGNQNHLDPELKIKPRSGPIPFNPPMELKDEPVEGGGEEGGAAPKKKDETEIIISNLYSKEELVAYFSKKPLVDEIRSLIEGWCNSISEIVIEKSKEEIKAKQSKG